MTTDESHLVAGAKLYDGGDFEITPDSVTHIDTDTGDPDTPVGTDSGNATFLALAGGCHRINFISSGISGKDSLSLDSMSITITDGTQGCTLIPTNAVAGGGGMGPPGP
jgi:hypothetical protein